MWGLIRKDLGEFVSTLKDDAAGTIKSAMTLGEGGEEYESSYEGSEDSETEGRRGPQPPHQERQHQATAALRAIRADIKTYTEEVPESQGERFSAFLERFDIGARTKEIATLLQEDPVVTKIHTQLVPEHLTYDDFWTRYFFRAEGVAKGKAGGGIAFPQDDDDEDEDFGWGEDDQDEDNNNNNNSPDLFPSRPPPASPSAQDPSPPPSPRAGDPRPPAGGALGAMRPEQERAAAADDEAVSPPVGGSAVGGVKSLASSAAMAEIARLNAALRESEAGRASLAAAAEEGRVSSPGSIGHGVKGEGDGEIGELRRERDAAVAEAEDLRSKIRQLETDYADAVAETVADLERAAATAATEQKRLQQRLEEECRARVAEAEEEARLHAAARAEAEERAAASAADAAAAAARSGGGGGDAVGEGPAAAAAAAEEVFKMKKAFREERAEHEAMLLASRQAANEAVEAALSSADADREEACAEIAASMEAEVDRKGEELEAVRLQLAKSEGALQQVSTLKADVEDLRRALQGERESAEKAASEARQEADVVKQLREEIRVLRAASQRPGTSPAAATGRGGPSGGSVRRSSGSRSDVAGGEDTDGWGEEEEDDSCAASSTNTHSSSVVVVDRPSLLTSHRGGSGRGVGAAAAAAAAEGDESSVSPGGGRAQQAGQERREGEGGDGEGEGDDGWEGWD